MLRGANSWAALSAPVVALMVVGSTVPASAAPLPAAHFDFGGVSRTYRVHVPPGVEHPSALVVNLHGAGQTGQDQANLTGYDAVADAHGFAVAYPDGVDFSWADGRGASVPDRQGIDDVGFISAMVEKLVADYGINRGRVFVTGMSAGGFMANRLGCQRADLFAAIAPVAGTLGTNYPCRPSQPVSVLEVHGTADPVVPYHGGPMTGRGGPSTIVGVVQMVDGWRRVDGCQGPPSDQASGAVFRSTTAGCAGGTAVELVRIDGAGHTWPAPSTFNAAEQSWRFFDAHAR
jgi:polyhydroxybutyrate depolymerase